MHNDTPLVSVIVPVYNTEPYLKKCLYSIKEQSLERIEIIVVNDGSPDNSQHIIDDIVKKDSRFVSIIKENGGLSSARNAGLEIANGEYISFIDSDDWIDKGFLKQLYDVAKETEADVVIGKLTLDDTIINKSYVLPGSKWGIQVFCNENKEQSIIRPLLRGEASTGFMVMCVWKNLYKRDLIGNIRFVSEREIMLEDYYFNLHQYYKAGKIAVCDCSDYHHTVVQNSLSKAYRKNLPEMTAKLGSLAKAYISATEKWEIDKSVLYEDINDFLRNSSVGICYNWCILSSGEKYSDALNRVKEVLNSDVFISVNKQKTTHKNPRPYMRLLHWIARNKLYNTMTISMILSRKMNYLYRMLVKMVQGRIHNV